MDSAVWAKYNDGNRRNGEVRGNPAHVLVGAVYTGSPVVQLGELPKADK
jgi:hypothetical protein